MKLRKLISGGQTGADEGGLEAGLAMGLETGGHAPKGFLTENGPNPELGTKYGVVEHTSELYPPRTITNVANSTGTIRFGFDFTTAGERCTLRAIKDLKKPDFKVDVLTPPPIEEAVAWLVEKNIEVLNVAGNRETTWPGMKDFVRDYLCRVIQATMLLEINDAG